MAYAWEHFTDYLDGTRNITAPERDELWDALTDLLERCGGRWSLDEEDMATVKASNLITDETSLVNDDDDTTAAGALATVLIAIEDTFTGQTGLDAFKAVAPDEDLNEEELAGLIDETGRVTISDDHKVWNLYKRVLDYLQCCPTKAPIIEHDSVGRSRSKFGFPGWVDTNKRYLRVDYSGALLWSYHGPGSCGSPGALYARDKYAISGYSQIDADGVCDPQGLLVGSDDLTDTTFLSCNFGCNPAGPYIGLGSCEILGASTGGPVPTDSYTQTTYTRTGTGCNIVGGVSPVFLSGVMTAALDPASEYTTPALISNVQADIADEGFDDDWNDTAGSYRNLSPDGLSYSERQGKTRLNLTGLTLVNGAEYRARYLIRFTPLVGAAVDGEETYQAFTFSTGMTHTDAIDIAVPDENGTNTLVFLGWLCAPFAE